MNEQDELGSTPLHYAAMNDNYEAVLILIVLAFQKIDLDVTKINFDFFMLIYL